MKELYRDIGFEILKGFNKIYKESHFDSETDGGVYSVLRLPTDLSIHFREWASKPFYIILFKKEKYLFELDLTRLVIKEGSYTWFLNRPTNKVNKKFLTEHLNWIDNIPDKYIENVRSIKSTLGSGVRIEGGGYEFCVNNSQDEMIEKLEDLIALAINAHSGLSCDKDDTYDFDSSEAMEGYNIDKLFTSKKRNQCIVSQRKNLDDNTCQACNLKLVINGKAVIDCHHLSPLSSGVRDTEIDDLVCLCPTCHRIAHLRNIPFSVEEIKVLLERT